MYRTIAQLDDDINTLVSTKPTLCSTVGLHNSVEGRPIRALRLRAGTATDRKGVLMVGGMHARELMNPDAIIELAFDLTQAYTDKVGLAYGGATFDPIDIKTIMETLDIWMLPCANPDGRNHVMKPGGDRLWRMNRRPNAGTSCIGVDLNRNCDFMWRVIGPTTVCDPCSTTQCFVGSLGFSEPESNNIHLLCDTQRIDIFVDVHSFSEFIIFPWGHAPTQTTQPLPNFTSLLAGFCRPLDPPSHQEYMSPSDQSEFQSTATRIKNTINAVRGQNYVLKSVYQVYGGTTSGTSSDYVWSRHIGNPTLRRTLGFSFETGPNVGDILLSFQPNDPEPVKNDCKAGLIALMQETVCGPTFIAETLMAGTVDPIRAARDEVLVTTEQGRSWLDLVSNI